MDVSVVVYFNDFNRVDSWIMNCTLMKNSLFAKSYGRNLFDFQFKKVLYSRVFFHRGVHFGLLQWFGSLLPKFHVTKYAHALAHVILIITRNSTKYFGISLKLQIAKLQKKALYYTGNTYRTKIILLVLVYTYKTCWKMTLEQQA